MSDDRASALEEARKKSTKNRGSGDDVLDMAGMELGMEGDLDAELGIIEDEEGSNEDGDEHVRIKEDMSDLIRQRYQVAGKPDHFNFRTEPLNALADNHTTFTTNDYFLEGVQPMPLFGASIKATEKKYTGYEAVSAYNKEKHAYTEFTEKYMPGHGTTEGGKGLALYPHVVIYHTADMSSIVNVNITFGCPSNCSFCKESLLARGFTQMDFEEGTGVIKVTLDDGKSFSIPSKARVKFYDTNQGKIVIGPLSVAIMNAFPIATDSLEKLRKGELYRVLAD